MVQTLTCRDEIIVLTKAIIIVKAYCSKSRIVQLFIFIFIFYNSSMTEGFNDWGGRGYDDFVPGEVTKTAPSGGRAT